ncbi:MAG: hypothetical protein GXP46_02950 [Deferribacteres bacterium]|nr:hypothetical protein [Deferribacteres bacterium]
MTEKGEDKITFQTGEGESVTVSINSGELPEGWPPEIPVLPGGKLVFVQAASKKKIRQINIEVKKPRVETFDFYMDRLNSSGWDIQSTLKLSGMNVATAKKGKEELILQVSDREQDITHVQIIVKL